MKRPDCGQISTAIKEIYFFQEKFKGAYSVSEPDLDLCKRCKDELAIRIEALQKVLEIEWTKYAPLRVVKFAEELEHSADKSILTSDNKVIVSIFSSLEEGHLIKIYNAESGELENSFPTHLVNLRNIVELPGDDLLIGGEDWEEKRLRGKVQLVDKKTGECLKTLNRHSSNIWSLSLTKYGEVISTGADRKIQIFNLDGTKIETMETPEKKYGLSRPLELSNGNIATVNAKDRIEIYQRGNKLPIKSFSVGKHRGILTEISPGKLLLRSFSKEDQDDVAVFDIETEKMEGEPFGTGTGRIWWHVTRDKNLIKVESVKRGENPTVTFYDLVHKTSKTVEFPYFISEIYDFPNGRLVTIDDNRNITTWGPVESSSK